MLLAKCAVGPISVAACLFAMVVVASVNAQPVDKEKILNELELADDDGSIDTAVMNYLFAKQIVNRLRAQGDITDLQRKRSYWKQCAFNAVSCFGQKREGYQTRTLVPTQRNGRWDFFKRLFFLKK